MPVDQVAVGIPTVLAESDEIPGVEFERLGKVEWRDVVDLESVHTPAPLADRLVLQVLLLHRMPAGGSQNCRFTLQYVYREP